MCMHIKEGLIKPTTEVHVLVVIYDKLYGLGKVMYPTSIVTL